MCEKATHAVSLDGQIYRFLGPPTTASPDCEELLRFRCPLRVYDPPDDELNYCEDHAAEQGVIW
jgi:hypothetical protein